MSLNKISIFTLGALSSLSFLSFTGTAAAQATNVVAVVNGTPITAEEVDNELGASLAKLQEQIYSLQRTELDSLIEERLIENEAKKRKITAAALTEAEITSRVPQVTTADASAFFEANKAKLQGAAFETIEAQIKTYLTTQRLTAKREEFIATLRNAATINVFMKAPAPFRADIPLEGAYVRGRADAPVTIVEFSDFHCPFCKRAYPVIQQLLARYGDKIRLVYKDMPLDNLHPDARAAAEAARCAGAQGKFWEFHDRLFTNDPDVTPATLDRFGKEVGLNLAEFDKCYAARQFKAQVEASAQEGTKLGVTGTPTFFINGRNLTGAQPLEAFAVVIDEELKQPPSGASAQKR